MRRSGVVAWIVASCAVGISGSVSAGDSTAAVGPQWWVAPPANGAIEGYAGAVSALPGETVDLKVNVPGGERYRIRVYRLGDRKGRTGDAELLRCIPSCTADEPGRDQGAPVINQASGLIRAPWMTTDRLRIDPSWPSSYLAVQFLLTSGPHAGSGAWSPLIVREPPNGHRAAILVQVPINTVEAYNDWGGKSTYVTHIEGPPATHVSFDRPFLDSLIGWEYPLVRFLENRGYDVAYQTDLDTHRDPASLQRHRLVIANGHGEYWTSTIRDAFETARAAGTNLLFFGANIGYWQVRYEDNGRTMVSYKTNGTDPVSDPALRTALFRVLNRAECALLGVQHQGGHLDWSRTDYRVDAVGAADPWFAGTGFKAGDRVAGVVSVEVDSIPDWRLAKGKTCIDQPMTILFRAERGGDYMGNARFVRYIAPSGARVAAAGTLEFGAAIDDITQRMEGDPSLVDSRSQRFITNALQDMLRPAAVTAVGAASDSMVWVRLGVPLDKRSHVELYRVAPGKEFATGAAGVTRVCSPCGPKFSERRRAGTHYVVVTADAWGQSLPADVPLRRARRHA